MTLSTEVFQLSKPHSKYLLVINKGPGAVKIKREASDWDLLEIYFMPSDINAIEKDPSISEADHIVFERDRNRRKFAIVKSIFMTTELLNYYDVVLLADDDVEPVDCSIKQIFDLFVETGCRIGQPALTQNSFYAHFLTIKNDNFIWRRTNHIDFMCIMMTSDALRDYMPMMDENISGFGLDEYWGYYEWISGTAHAVLDSTPMWHSRPVGGGQAHKTLDDPKREFNDFVRRHKLPTFPHICLDGVPKPVQYSAAAHVGRSLTGYSQELLRDPNFLNYAASEVSVLHFRYGNTLAWQDLKFNNKVAEEVYFGWNDFNLDTFDLLSFSGEHWASLEVTPQYSDFTRGSLQFLIVLEGKSPALRIALGSGAEDPWSDCSERYLNILPGVNVVSLEYQHFRRLRGDLDPQNIRQMSIGGFGAGVSALVRIWCILPAGTQQRFG